MNKKTLVAVIATILIMICAVIAIALTHCVSSEESSVIDESEVSEPSETSVEADVSADSSDASKDSAEIGTHSDEPSDEVSKEQENNSTTPKPNETSKEESTQPGEASKPAEESKETEISKNEETSTTPDEIVKPDEESKVEETSKDETSKGETSKEENVVHGNTPLNVVINGKKETVDSYEEAKVLLTLEDLETAEAGYEVVIEKNGRTLTLTCNGDGTYVSSSGSTRSAQQVYDTYISQWCSYCGKRAGDGTNGTCVRKLIDVDCSRCGEPCKMLECHTCVE